MPFDMTTVLFVDDQDRYPQYRAEIALLLKAIGGASRYDFEIVKTLKSEAGHDINRVFIRRFPDCGAIRARLFETAVRRMTTSAEHAG